MTQLQGLTTLVVLGLSEFCRGLPAEGSMPVVRQRRQPQEMVEWSIEKVKEQLGGILLPPVTQYVPGGSQSLADCMNTPPSSRAAAYSPIIDVAIEMVFGDEWYIVDLMAELRKFLNSDKAYQILMINFIDVNSLTSVGELLDAIFQIAVLDPDIADNKLLYSAIQYFQGNIMYGGPPPTQLNAVYFDVVGIFGALDFSGLNRNPEAVESMGHLLHFLRNNSHLLEKFQSSVHWSSIRSRGDCLNTLLRWLTSGLPDYVEESAGVLQQYVGEGRRGVGPFYRYKGSSFGYKYSLRNPRRGRKQQGRYRGRRQIHRA